MSGGRQVITKIAATLELPDEKFPYVLEVGRPFHLGRIELMQPCPTAERGMFSRFQEAMIGLLANNAVST